MTTPSFLPPLGSALLRAVLAAACAASLPASAAEHDHHATHGAHAAHGAPAPGGLTRSVAAYALPRVALVRQDGRKIEFPAHIDDGQPVFLNFIYTTCTAICPPMSQAFAELQEALGNERVRLVSVSIDPEQDTPRRLAEYAHRFRAGPQWTFLTGTVEASIEVQKALGGYRGDKMNHTPLTLFRPAPGRPWVRLEGFATPQQLLQEYRSAAR